MTPPCCHRYLFIVKILKALYHLLHYSLLISKHLFNRHLQILWSIIVELDVQSNSLADGFVHVVELISKHGNADQGHPEVQGFGGGQKTAMSDEEDAVWVSWKAKEVYT